MNWIDRVVGYVSPVTGLRRDAARKMLTRSAPSGAKRAGIDDRGWYLNSGDPNDARPRRFMDRQAILRLVAENPYARKALNALLNSLIGWGITGAPQGSKAIKTAWAEWVKVCDYRGKLDLYGIQELVARSMFRDGEVFIAARFVSNVAGIPLRLQMFDKGMLATSLTGDNMSRGIEYDADGNPVAYHFYRGRVGQRWSNNATIRFPASECIHLFHAEVIGQTEGVSVFETVVKRLGDVDEGIDAEVVKANIAACMVGFRYRPPAQTGEDPSIGIPTERSVDGAPVEEFIPGMINTLEDGEQITFSNPPRAGSITDLARIALLASAAGVGVTYEQMTGDLSNINFSSYKAGHLEFKRTIGRIQYLTFTPQFLDRVWGWWLRAGIDFGQLPNRKVAMKWTPPPFESIDREGDAKADILEMQAGLESRPNLLASRGFDHDEMMTDIARGQDFIKKLGLAFKGDPFSPFQTDTADPAASADAQRLLMLGFARALLSGSQPNA